MRYFKKTIQFITLLFVAFLIHSYAVEHLRAVDPGPKQGQQGEKTTNLPQGAISTGSTLSANDRPSIQDPARIGATFNAHAAEYHRFYSRDIEYLAEPGRFNLFPGPNSREVQRGEITLE